MVKVIKRKFCIYLSFTVQYMYNVQCTYNYNDNETNVDIGIDSYLESVIPVFNRGGHPLIFS
jgi:hypothetical protein